MATAYSSNLALALPVTGELSGTWGTTVNTQITNMLDEALGYQVFSATGGTDTLTIPDGTTGVARSIFIQLTGTGGGTVTVPATKTKMYFVFNDTTALAGITFKVTGGTGVSIPPAGKMALVSDGTNMIVAQNYFSALTLGAALPVASGGTGLTAGTSGGVLAYTASGTLASSAALAASALVIGGGAGAAPSTTTTGTGVVTALGVNTGTAGAFVVNGGALGSPSTAGTMPAFTLGGTVSGGGNQINNVIIGTTTPLAGSFTTISSTLSTGTANATFNSTANTPFINFSESAASKFAIGESSIVGGGGAGFYDFYATAGIGQRFFTAAAERVRILSGGAVLIGNTVAVSGAKLEVTGTLSATGTLSGGTSGTGYSFSGSAPATSLTLNSSGNVGIGAAPIYRAQVTAAATNGSVVALGIENPQAAASANLNATVDLRFDLNGSGAAIIRAGKDGDYMNDTNCDGNLQFYTNLNNQFALSAPVERMRLDSNGNLLVGGTSSTVWNGASGTKFVVSGSSNTIVSLQSSTTTVDQGAIFEGYATSVTSNSPALGSIVFLRANTSNTALSSYTAFYTNNAGSVDERARIDSSGNLTISNGNLIVGTANKGIDFSANSSAAGMTSELLNDYEEGTWTPIDASSSALTFTSVSAYYTKVGNMVFATFELVYPASSSSAGNVIGGLPFTSATGSAMNAFNVSYTSYSPGLMAPIDANATTFTLYDTTTVTAINNTALLSKLVRGTCIYKAA